ncbi:MAG: beta-lactamase family protein [Lachnospiraceae bacterium]|nr:beta-lactamase family protein [Lachnospiraceae bacterium]
MDFTNLKKFMDFMAAERTPGNAVEVYQGGTLVFRYASGYSDLAAKKLMTGEEMFNIYSCSKVAAVTAATQLLEQGKILLNDPLYDYIPEFREMYVKKEDGTLTKAKNPITINHLFTMTAGFTYDMDSKGFQLAKKVTNGKMDTLTTIRCAATDPLAFEPGTRWGYSICHDVLAAVVEVVSGQKFRDYMKDHIFAPLDMGDTVYHHTEETLKRTAAQYAFVPAGSEEFDIVEAQKYGSGNEGMFKELKKEADCILGEEYDSGGGGIITTVSDYAKLTAALANYGLGLTGERILSPYSVNLMRTNRLSEEQLKYFDWKQLAGCGYGLGVRTHIDKIKSGQIGSLGEFGWGGAAGSTVMVDPEINLGVFYVQHTLNPREEYYQPRLRNVVYSCLDK